MKKILLLSLICLMNTYVLPNKIQDAVQEIYDEIVPPYMPIVQEQRVFIKKFEPATWYEMLIGSDPQYEAEREIIRQNPEAKKFLEEFFTLNAQVLGIDEIRDCLNEQVNPTARDLDLCRSEWLKSYSRWYALNIVAASNEKAFKLNDHLFTHAFYEGDRKLEKRINQIVEENSEEQE